MVYSSNIKRDLKIKIKKIIIITRGSAEKKQRIYLWSRTLVYVTKFLCFFIQEKFRCANFCKFSFKLLHIVLCKYENVCMLMFDGKVFTEEKDMITYF